MRTTKIFVLWFLEARPRKELGNISIHFHTQAHPVVITSVTTGAEGKPLPRILGNCTRLSQSWPTLDHCDQSGVITARQTLSSDQRWPRPRPSGDVRSSRRARFQSSGLLFPNTRVRAIIWTKIQLCRMEFRNMPTGWELRGMVRNDIEHTFDTLAHVLRLLLKKNGKESSKHNDARVAIVLSPFCVFCQMQNEPCVCRRVRECCAEVNKTNNWDIARKNISPQSGIGRHNSRKQAFLLDLFSKPGCSWKNCRCSTQLERRSTVDDVAKPPVETKSMLIAWSSKRKHDCYWKQEIKDHKARGTLQLCTEHSLCRPTGDNWFSFQKQIQKFYLFDSQLLCLIHSCFDKQIQLLGLFIHTHKSKRTKLLSVHDIPNRLVHFDFTRGVDFLPTIHFIAE